MEDDVTTISLKSAPDQVLIKGRPEKGLVLLDAKSIQVKHLKLVVSDTHLTKLWHYRLGHPSMRKLQQLVNQGLASGIPKFSVHKENHCEPCIFGKQEKQPHPASTSRTTGLLDLVHMDICGPMENKSIGGSLYFVMFTDDYSRFTCIYFLSSRSEVFGRFKEYLTYSQRFTSSQLKVLRSDNGGEYTLREFDSFCKNHGIQRHFTVSYTPEQNGVAEKRNKDLNNSARCMLQAAGLRKSY